MAGPACMSDDGRQAVFVGTMLSTGDAVALCDECMVPWAAAILQAMTGVDPTPFLLAISDDAGDPRGNGRRRRFRGRHAPGRAGGDQTPVRGVASGRAPESEAWPFVARVSRSWHGRRPRRQRRSGDQ